MIEQTMEHISVLSVIEAGLLYSINPASFLGCFLFLFLIIRIQKIYGIANVFGAAVLFVFFSAQMLLHLGLSDVFYTSAKWFVSTLHVLRIVFAAIVLSAGGFLFWQIYMKRISGKEALSRIFYFQLPLDIRISFIKRSAAVLRGIFWGLVLALFCGIWPLQDTALYLLYQIASEPNQPVFWKFILFETCAVWMFLIILFAACRIFRRPVLGVRILNSRIVLPAFSAFCIAAGFSTLIYYVTLFI